VFHDLESDLSVIMADRHAGMTTAIAASCVHIPLIPIQGGEREGSID